MHQQVVKIGVLISPLAENYDARALKYLILNMNTLQESFEFQVLPLPESNLLDKLSYNHIANRAEIEALMPSFLDKYKVQLSKWSKGYGLNGKIDFPIVILSSAKFADNYYQTGGTGWSIVALGNWKNLMAPPSIIEYLISMLVRTAIDEACNGSFPARHMGTKGCCFDFSAQIEDARYYALSGFICSDCKKTIVDATNTKMLEDATLLANKMWLGTVSEPSHVSVTAKKLGHDLFHTMGVKPTLKEKISSTVQDEAVKGIIKTIFLVLGAALLVYLGLKKGS